MDYAEQQQQQQQEKKPGFFFPTHHNATVEDAADNGCSCAGGLGQRHSPGMQGRIAVVVGEVEARHLEAAAGAFTTSRAGLVCFSCIPGCEF